jgi:hypothetical protein
MSWLHGFYDKQRYAVASTTQIFWKAGFVGIRAVMSAFDKTLRQAGRNQKALLLMCAACGLPKLDRAQSAVCASWCSRLLHDPSPELRVCGVIWLQRLLAGNKVPEAAQIGELLGDNHDGVRRAAIVALGSLGCQAAAFQEALLEQLGHPSAQIRYAALKTLGSLQATARPSAYRIATMLQDDVTACRVAALRALRCIGVGESFCAVGDRSRSDYNLLTRMQQEEATMCWKQGKRMRVPDEDIIDSITTWSAISQWTQALRKKSKLLARKLGKLEFFWAKAGQAEVSINRTKRIQKMKQLQLQCSALMEAVKRKAASLRGL